MERLLNCFGAFGVEKGNTFRKHLNKETLRMSNARPQKHYLSSSLLLLLAIEPEKSKAMNKVTRNGL
jgi:hypothetical protein